jgi:cytochrome P450
MSVAVAATLHYLAVTPEYQRSVAQEIRQRFGAYEEILPGTKLKQCVSLTAAINESLRMAPPTPGCFWRVLMEDTMIDGHLIRRGTEVAVCQYAIHHSAEYFPQPYRFLPERFDPTKASHFPQGAMRAFNPFSTGPRSCPARNFAERQVSLSLARIIWLADFRPSRSNTLPSSVPDGKEFDTPSYVLRDVFTAKGKGPVLEFQLRRDIDCPWNSEKMGFSS